MIRKIFLALLCTAVALALFACVADEPQQTNSNSSAASNITDISVLQSTVSAASFGASDVILLPTDSSAQSAVDSGDETEPSDSAASTEDSAGTTSQTSSEAQSEASSETSSEPVTNTKPHTVNGFLVDGNRAMELFGGGAASGAETAKLINNFKQRVGSSVNVYAMPIPTASAFYAPAGYENSKIKTQECFYGLRDALVDVTFVDTLQALAPHTDEMIYARTDHHWFALGAYYASQELCKQANAAFTPISELQQKSFDGFLGSIYSSYKVNELGKYPETFVWYEPTQECTAHYYTQDYKHSFDGSIFSRSSSYMKFIYGDGYAVRVETGVKNGRKLLLIKDSFGNALTPYMVAGFEEVYVVDFRAFERNILTFIDDNDITDVAFTLSSFSIAGSKRNNITRLMNI